MRSSSNLIVTFHGVGDVPFGTPEEEIPYWVSVDRFEALLDAIASFGGEITFDDGNASDVEIVLPRLVERDLKASFFLLLGRIGSTGSVTWAGVRELGRHGMAVGVHGRRHVDWRRVDDKTLQDEVVAARDDLATATGLEVDIAACPFGAYDRRVLRSLRAAGYRSVFTSDGGSARSGEWLQPRNTLLATHGPEDVERLAASSTRMPPLRRLELLVKRIR